MSRKSVARWLGVHTCVSRWNLGRCLHLLFLHNITTASPCPLSYMWIFNPETSINLTWLLGKSPNPKNRQTGFGVWTRSELGHTGSVWPWFPGPCFQDTWICLRKLHVSNFHSYQENCVRYVSSASFKNCPGSNDSAVQFLLKNMPC